MNRTITKCARSMRLDVGLPKEFWAETINTAVYLINKSPLVPSNEGLLEEICSDKKVFLSYLKLFGCSSYVYIDVRLRI